MMWDVLPLTSADDQCQDTDIFFDKHNGGGDRSDNFFLVPQSGDNLVEWPLGTVILRSLLVRGQVAGKKNNWRTLSDYQQVYNYYLRVPLISNPTSSADD